MSRLDTNAAETTVAKSPTLDMYGTLGETTGKENQPSQVAGIFYARCEHRYNSNTDIILSERRGYRDHSNKRVITSTKNKTDSVKMTSIAVSTDREEDDDQYDTESDEVFLGAIDIMGEEEVDTAVKKCRLQVLVDSMDARLIEKFKHAGYEDELVDSDASNGNGSASSGGSASASNGKATGKNENQAGQDKAASTGSKSKLTDNLKLGSQRVKSLIKRLGKDGYLTIVNQRGDGSKQRMDHFEFGFDSDTVTIEKINEKIQKAWDVEKKEQRIWFKNTDLTKHKGLAAQAGVNGGSVLYLRDPINTGTLVRDPNRKLVELDMWWSLHRIAAEFQKRPFRMPKEELVGVNLYQVHEKRDDKFGPTLGLATYAELHSTIRGKVSHLKLDINAFEFGVEKAMCEDTELERGFFVERIELEFMTPGWGKIVDGTGEIRSVEGVTISAAKSETMRSARTAELGGEGGGKLGVTSGRESGHQKAAQFERLPVDWSIKRESTGKVTLTRQYWNGETYQPYSTFLAVDELPKVAKSCFLPLWFSWDLPEKLPWWIPSLGTAPVINIKVTMKLRKIALRGHPFIGAKKEWFEGEVHNSYRTVCVEGGIPVCRFPSKKVSWGAIIRWFALALIILAVLFTRGLLLAKSMRFTWSLCVTLLEFLNAFLSLLADLKSD